MAFLPARRSAHGAPYRYCSWSRARARPNQEFSGEQTRAQQNFPPLRALRWTRPRRLSFVRVPLAQVLQESFREHSRAPPSALLTMPATALRALANAPSYLRVRGTNTAADPCA